jgi:hypothetical protein
VTPRAAIGLFVLASGCCFGSAPGPSPVTAPPLPPADPALPSSLPACEGARCPLLEADAIAADGDEVYVAAGARLVALEESAASTRYVAPISALIVSSVALTDTHVYWTEQRFQAPGVIVRAPRAGGAREELHVLSSYATQLAVDDLGLCWIAESRLECAELDGTEVRVVLAPATVFGLGPATDGPRDVFVQSEDTFSVVPRAGGPPRLTEAITQAPRPSPTALVVGDDGVYVGETETRIYGRISRRALDGSGRTELAHGQWWPTALALLGDRVLGTASEVGIVSVPRAGGPATVPLPHGSFELYRRLAVTDRFVWMVQGDPAQLYRIPRATLEAATTAPPAPR